MSDHPTRRTDQWSKKLRIAKFVLSVLLLILLVLIVMVQFITLTRVLEITDQTKSTTERLLSCTEPTGACYKSGDRRSGAAVKSITDQQKQVVTIAAYCAKQPGNNTLEQIEDCVNKELKR